MSRKNSRSGGKFSGNHTTVIPVAGTVADIAESLSDVTKISPGFIKSGLRSVRGGCSVKITDRDGGLLLTVRGNTSIQEIAVYTNDVHSTKLAIARGAREAGMRISFGDRSEPLQSTS